MVDLAAPFLDSLPLGDLYTMMALGLTITYKVTRVPNFAHAELVTVGSYAGVRNANTWGRGLGGSPTSSSPLFFIVIDRKAYTKLIRVLLWTPEVRSVRGPILLPVGSHSGDC